MVGKTRSQSFRLSQKIISIISSLLSNNGKIIVEELNFHSHIAPSITSSIIFHTLKFLNFIKLDISSLSNRIQPGLEVNFFHKKQLEGLLEKYGKVELIREKPIPVTFIERLCLLKKFSSVSYCVSLQVSK